MKNLLLKSAARDNTESLPAHAFAILSAEMQGCPRSPAESSADPAPPLQTVVLCHRLSQGHSHFDWLIEQPATTTTPAHDPDARVLMAFRMTEQLDQLCAQVAAFGPIETAGLGLPAHRWLYLDYEGPISGNRGSVRQIAKGTVRWLIHKSDRIELCIIFGTHSCKITGLCSAEGRLGTPTPDRWRLRIEPA